MLPFDRYREKGRKLLGRPEQGDATCRHGYGLAVFAQCGLSCVYCGRFLGKPYDAWLDISVDHVIPRSIFWSNERREWIEDIANMVTCCRACNEFLNRFKVDVPLPESLSAFFDLRDRIFLEKREHALRRHKEESGWYERWSERWSKTKTKWEGDKGES